jgi:lycopene cyclase domain-containing protein
VTYARFHAVFILPWLLLGGRHLQAMWSDPHTLRVVGVTLAIVYLFTVPWDNWAAAKGIWGFTRDRYSLRWGHLPVEEYAFFGLQTLLALMLHAEVSSWIPEWNVTAPRPHLAWCLVPLGAWPLLGSVTCRILRECPRWRYVLHMGFWMLPLVGMQWVAGPDILLRQGPRILATTVLLGTYLTGADILAVRWKLWFFDPQQVTGPRLFRVLPWEEACFFLITTLLVVQSSELFRVHLPGGPP